MFVCGWGVSCVGANRPRAIQFSVRARRAENAKAPKGENAKRHPMMEPRYAPSVSPESVGLRPPVSLFRSGLKIAPPEADQSLASGCRRGRLRGDRHRVAHPAQALHQPLGVSFPVAHVKIL